MSDAKKKTTIPKDFPTPEKAQEFISNFAQKYVANVQAARAQAGLPALPKE